MRIDTQLDLEAKETLTICYSLQNMHKVTEKTEIAFTHEVNNGYYCHCLTCKYVYNRYIVQ